MPSHHGKKGASFFGWLSLRGNPSKKEGEKGRHPREKNKKQKGRNPLGNWVFNRAAVALHAAAPAQRPQALAIEAAASRALGRPRHGRRALFRVLENVKRSCFFPPQGKPKGNWAFSSFSWGVGLSFTTRPSAGATLRQESWDLKVLWGGGALPHALKAESVLPWLNQVARRRQICGAPVGLPLGFNMTNAGGPNLVVRFHLFSFHPSPALETGTHAHAPDHFRVEAGAAAVSLGQLGESSHATTKKTHWDPAWPKLVALRCSSP